MSFITTLTNKKPRILGFFLCLAIMDLCSFGENGTFMAHLLLNLLNISIFYIFLTLIVSQSIPQ